MKKTNVIAVLLLAAIAIRLLPALDHKHFWPLGDDSYYALSVARNIAEGNGITYSGSLTNGVQPLYVFISIPFYYIFGQNDLLTITCILLMLAMINAGTGLLIYGLLRRVAGESGALLGFVIWSFSPYVIEHGVNGLETPLTTFFFAASAWFYIAKVRAARSPRAVDLIILGSLLGLGVLSRVSMGLWAAAIAIDMIIFSDDVPFLKRFADVLIMTLISLAVTFPWFLYSLRVSDSIVPMGGQAVNFISRAYGYNHWGARYSYFPVNSVPLKYYFLSMKSSLSQILQSFDLFSTVFTIKGLLLVIIVVGIAFKEMIWKIFRQFPFLLLFPAFEIVAYSFYIFGQWFYARYYYATFAALLVFMCMVYQSVIDAVPAVRFHQRWIFCCVVLFLLLVAWGNFPQRCIQKQFNSFDALRRSCQAKLSEVPRGETVGAFQSGALEYFVRDRRVINLDGVVNSSALKAMKEMRMSEYLSRNNINWMIDWDWIIDALYVRRSSQPDAIAAWKKVGEWGETKLYQRITTVRKLPGK